MILLLGKIVLKDKSMYQIDFLAHEFDLNFDMTQHGRRV